MRNFETRPRPVLIPITLPKALSSTDAYKIEYDDSNGDFGGKNIGVGAWVYHTNYHRGKVISLFGAGRSMRAQVRFDGDGQVRTIMLTHLQPAH